MNQPTREQDDEQGRPFLVGGIPVTPFESLSHAVQAIIVNGDVRPGFAVAINAEKVIRSRSDESLRKSIDSATLCYADGTPIAWSLARQGKANSRIPGCELWEELMREAGRWDIPVFLIGARPDIHDLTRERLVQEFNTPVVDSCHGYFEDRAATIKRVAASRARIVTVAMGSPAQEDFIRECRASHPDAFYMGVGGSYDVFVGATRRAPRWMRDNGLEWLHRLARQPTRLGRQFVLVKYMYLYLLRRV